MASPALLHAFEPGPIRRAMQISRHLNTLPSRQQPSTTAWDRLVRYVSARDGSVRYGDPIIPNASASDASGSSSAFPGSPDIDGLARAGRLEVRVLEGSVKDAGLFGLKGTGERDVVGELLGPLTPGDVPVVRCVGLNYRSHILEAGMGIPTNPTLSTKPSPTVTSPRTAIPIPRIAQSTCDYEGELTIVIGRDCKNVSEANALDYVAGYTVGNDLSCREWQLETEKAGPSPQWSFSKSFDQFAPVGPCITSVKVLGEAKGLGLRTWVNGEVRQEGGTGDLVFGVRRLVSFLSTGQTLQAGSLIMTGTPAGVGMGLKPPKYLKDGDEVVVEIEGIGKMVNTIHFE